MPRVITEYWINIHIQILQEIHHFLLKIWNRNEITETDRFDANQGPKLSWNVKNKALYLSIFSYCSTLSAELFYNHNLELMKINAVLKFDKKKKKKNDFTFEWKDRQTDRQCENNIKYNAHIVHWVVVEV